MEKNFSQTQENFCYKQKSCQLSDNKEKKIFYSKKRIIISGSLKIRKSEK